MDERTAAIWRRYTRHGDAAARDQLALDNLPLVRFVLGRLPFTLPPSLSGDDLISVGYLALLRAIGSFDPDRGVEFATFAVPRIRGAMYDELRAHDTVPRSVRRRANAIERAHGELIHEGTPTPTSEQLAERAGLKPRQVERALAAVGCRSLLSLESLFRTPAGGREQKIIESAADATTASPLTAVMTKERDRMLATAIAALPETERRVIILYYQHELMLKEIADVLAVTKSRVSQLHTQALFRLRSQIAARSQTRRRGGSSAPAAAPLSTLAAPPSLGGRAHGRPTRAQAPRPGPQAPPSRPHES